MDIKEYDAVRIIKSNIIGVVCDIHTHTDGRAVYTVERLDEEKTGNLSEDIVDCLREDIELYIHTSSTFKFKFMFDWGSGACIWSINDAAIEKYDYPVKHERLPISSELSDYLYALIDEHDEAFNWDNPSGDLLWDETRQNAFREKAKEAYSRLCSELSEEYEVELWEHCLI